MRSTSVTIDRAYALTVLGRLQANLRLLAMRDRASGLESRLVSTMWMAARRVLESAQRRPVLGIAGGAVTTALAIACAQAPIGIGWIACLALTPWLVAVRRPILMVVTGTLWGTLAGIIMGYWIYGGLRNIGATPAEAATGLSLTAFAVTGVPGGLYGAAAALARSVPSGRSLVFAFAVGGIDWARAIPHIGLPWGLLGHSQASVAGVAQLAVLGGVPLISSHLAGLSYCLADMLAAGRPRSRAPALLTWAGSYAALMLFGLHVAQALAPSSVPAGAERTLLAVQHRISPGARWSASLQEANVAMIGRRTLEAAEALASPPDLVLWPETAITEALEGAPRLASKLRSLLPRLAAPLVLGGVSPAGSEPHYRNSVIWLDESGEIRDRFHKTLAVPFVERRPASWLARRVQRMFGADSIDRLVVEGTEQRPLRGDDDYAVVLCFEVIYPALVSRRLESDSLAILNLANDAWYGSDTPGEQQLAFARFRAIEHRRYLVRVADSGPSAVVDPLGRIVRELAPRDAGAIAATIAATRGPALSERIAMLSLAVGGAITGLGAGKLAQRRWNS